MSSRSRKRVGIGVLIASALVVVVLFFVFFNPFGGGNSSAEEMNDGQKMAEDVSIVDACDRPDSFFDIQYQSHVGGFIIDDGLPVDPVLALEKIALVTAQDPTVLRYFANDVFNRQYPGKYGMIPEDKDLMILAQRKEEWQRLCQFLTLPDLVFVSVEIEGEIQNHVMSVTGVVGTSTDQTTPGERGLAIYFEGEEYKAVVLRNLCSNMVTKTDKPVVIPTPRKEVSSKTPTNTPPVVKTPPPSPTDPVNTPPDGPTATPKNTPPNVPMPTNTPRNTSTPPPTQTPAPTFTPPVPCCPTAEFTPPAEGGTPIRPTATPRPTRTPLPEPTQDRSDPVLPTPVSVF